MRIAYYLSKGIHWHQNANVSCKKKCASKAHSLVGQVVNTNTCEGTNKDLELQTTIYEKLDKCMLNS